MEQKRSVEKTYVDKRKNTTPRDVANTILSRFNWKGQQYLLMFPSGLERKTRLPAMIFFFIRRFFDSRFWPLDFISTFTYLSFRKELKLTSCLVLNHTYLFYY